MTLTDKAAKVASREDLVAFVQVLAEDFAKRGKEWENRDLGRYLDALAGFLGDLDGYYQNRGQKVPARPEWRTMAEVLLAATQYE